MQRYLALLPFLAAVLAVSLSGAMYRPGAWYLALQKPTWTPPGWLFAPVWTTLYVMIAMAGWMAWLQRGFGALLAIWATQLLLNASWSWVMFGRHEIGTALLVLGLLWLTILAFAIKAWPQSRAASLLFAPYLAWVSFAGALNFAIWQLNS